MIYLILIFGTPIVFFCGYMYGNIKGYNQAVADREAPDSKYLKEARKRLKKK